MHDPLVVAFTIPRPWPSRSSFSATGSAGDGVRWRSRLHHDCGPWCAGGPPHKAGAFPWWKPGSYSKFWRLAGKDYYWPPLITIWHREPGGRDALSVCRARVRRRHGKRAGEWKLTKSWHWHVHHWRIQVHPFQALRRWALTRCAWCGGRSRKGDLVNISHSWDGPRGHWWQGEPGLFHEDCSAVQHAHRTCLCKDPLPVHGDHGTCQRCGKFHAWHYEPDEADHLLASLPWGSRITPERRPAIEAAWALRRARKEEAGA